jgi:cytochrome b involved in lipid metabolism
MNTKTITIGIVVLVLLGGGYWYSTTAQAPSYTSTAPNTPTPAESAVPGTTYTLADVATHPDRTSCWSAINGNVYDLTTWIDRHPGGADRILSICGKDGSSAFSKKHLGEPKPEAMLATFKIGVLKN